MIDNAAATIAPIGGPPHLAVVTIHAGIVKPAAFGFWSCFFVVFLTVPPTAEPSACDVCGWVTAGGGMFWPLDGGSFGCGNCSRTRSVSGTNSDDGMSCQLPSINWISTHAWMSAPVTTPFFGTAPYTTRAGTPMLLELAINASAAAYCSSSPTNCVSLRNEVMRYCE